MGTKKVADIYDCFYSLKPVMRFYSWLCLILEKKKKIRQGFKIDQDIAVVLLPPCKEGPLAGHQ